MATHQGKHASRIAHPIPDSTQEVKPGEVLADTPAPDAHGTPGTDPGATTSRDTTENDAYASGHGSGVAKDASAQTTDESLRKSRADGRK